jgi:hypothetical protein
MKTLLLILFSCSLFAQTAPVKLGAILQQGTTTLYCERVNVRSLGGVFALSKPYIGCLLHTSNPQTTDFTVTVVTQDATGATHTYSGATAVDVDPSKYSPIGFTTDDTILVSVNVKETGLIASNDFDGLSAEVVE